MNVFAKEWKPTFAIPADPSPAAPSEEEQAEAEDGGECTSPSPPPLM
jgi:hypothetical protein